MGGLRVYIRNYNGVGKVRETQLTRLLCKGFEGTKYLVIYFYSAWHLIILACILILYVIYFFQLKKKKKLEKRDEKKEIKEKERGLLRLEFGILGRSHFPCGIVLLILKSH